ATSSVRRKVLQRVDTAPDAGAPQNLRHLLCACHSDRRISPAILNRPIGFFLTEYQRVTVSQPQSSDTQFFNSFSMVLGLLVAFAIVLFAFARSIGADTQQKYVLEEPLHLKDMQANIAPFAKVAIAGHDNSALAAIA